MGHNKRGLGDLLTNIGFNLNPTGYNQTTNSCITGWKVRGCSYTPNRLQLHNCTVALIYSKSTKIKLTSIFKHKIHQYPQQFHGNSELRVLNVIFNLVLTCAYNFRPFLWWWIRTQENQADPDPVWNTVPNQAVPDPVWNTVPNLCKDSFPI